MSTAHGRRTRASRRPQPGRADAPSPRLVAGRTLVASERSLPLHPGPRAHRVRALARRSADRDRRARKSAGSLSGRPAKSSPSPGARRVSRRISSLRPKSGSRRLGSRRSGDGRAQREGPGPGRPCRPGGFPETVPHSSRRMVARTVGVILAAAQPSIDPQSGCLRSLVSAFRMPVTTTISCRNSLPR